ncbi:hypothetical protein TZ00_15770 [Agreia bicolorata]|uniref:Uncharacterized protein n=1 Tax=Agreia bicolorata TaxID=110935 RepID=A0ABR5CC77_9MICO|nr:hypothetical protein TZ00_15770 [Agreia bicolorata]
MIIEAGYDIVELLINGVANRRKKDTEDVDENPLWVLTMDAQLRYWSTTRVVDRMGSSSAEHVDDIARTLNEEPRYSRYYVLAPSRRSHATASATTSVWNTSRGPHPSPAHTSGWIARARHACSTKSCSKKSGLATETAPRTPIRDRPGDAVPINTRRNW